MYCRLAVVMAEHDPKLSQRRLSEETGLGVSTIGRLFNNTFDRVDRNTVEKLCNYFDRELSELFVLKEVDEDKGEAND